MIPREIQIMILEWRSLMMLNDSRREWLNILDEYNPPIQQGGWGRPSSGVIISLFQSYLCELDGSRLYDPCVDRYFKLDSLVNHDTFKRRSVGNWGEQSQGKLSFYIGNNDLQHTWTIDQYSPNKIKGTDPEIQTKIKNATKLEIQ